MSVKSSYCRRAFIFQISENYTSHATRITMINVPYTTFFCKREHITICKRGRLRCSIFQYKTKPHRYNKTKLLCARKIKKYLTQKPNLNINITEMYNSSLIENIHGTVSCIAQLNLGVTPAIRR